VLYELLRDLLLLGEGVPDIRNQDIRRELEALAAVVQFAWIRRAVVRVDEIVQLLRRNIQRTIALDALVMELREPANS
jgi:DNA polymerase III subunit delta'